MSVKIMALVFDSRLERDKKFIALAYADHADHDGQNMYPAIATISRKTGYSERQVQRVLAQLICDGILYRTGYGPAMTYRYAFNLHKLAAYGGGDILTPPSENRGDILTGGGDILTGGGDTHVTEGGDIAMSPESSFNHPLNRPIKPSGDKLSPLDHKIQTAWRGTLDLIRTDIPHATQTRYLNQLKLSGRSDEFLFLVGVPDQDTCAWAESRLRTILRRQLSGAMDHPVDVEFYVEA